MSSLQEQGDALRREAQELLYGLLPSTTNGRNVNRFVECVITATILEILAMQEQAAQPDTTKPE